MKLATIIGYCLGGGVALISLATANSSKAATFFDTTPRAFTSVGAFGEFATGLGGTLGQTFIAPTTDNILNDFSFFYTDGPPNLDVTDFRAFVAAFDGTTNKIVGDILFESASQSTTLNPGVKQELTFNTGGLTLTSGQEYIVFLSPTKDLDGLTGFGYLTLAEDATPSQDGGGRYVYSIGRSFSDLVAQPFITPRGNPNQDLGFKASFTSSEPVPEPTSVLGVLPLGAFGGVAAFKRKRKQITLN